MKLQYAAEVPLQEEGVPLGIQVLVIKNISRNETCQFAFLPTDHSLDSENSSEKSRSPIDQSIAACKEAHDAY